MTLLVTLTVVEVVLVVAVLAVYLVRIRRSLARTNESLAKVGFGVRAIETQTGSVGPSIVRINEQMAQIAAALGHLAQATEGAVEPGKHR